jgi:urease accessory protein
MGTPRRLIRTFMNTTEPNFQALLHLLQLVNSTLPVGAYSYSEGLETLVQANTIANAQTLQHWLLQELNYGAIRLEAAAMIRIYQGSGCLQDSGDWDSSCRDLGYWNHWLSAVRETEELREQSWQMGRSLTRLLLDLEPQIELAIAACGTPCNFATAFAIAAHYWQIDCKTAILGYLYSWVANLVNAGVRLIPLGQTVGQRLLFDLNLSLRQTVDVILTLQDDDLSGCGWGLAIASMNHETLYSRLFRS